MMRICSPVKSPSGSRMVTSTYPGCFWARTLVSCHDRYAGAWTCKDGFTVGVNPGPRIADAVARRAISSTPGSTRRRHSGASSTGGASGAKGRGWPPVAPTASYSCNTSVLKRSHPSCLMRNFIRFLCLCW